MAGRSDFALASDIQKFWGERTYPTHPAEILLFERAPQQIKQYFNLFITFDAISWSGIVFCYILTSIVMGIGLYVLKSEKSIMVTY